MAVQHWPYLAGNSLGSTDVTPEDAVFVGHWQEGTHLQSVSTAAKLLKLTAVYLCSKSLLLLFRDYRCFIDSVKQLLDLFVLEACKLADDFVACLIPEEDRWEGRNVVLSHQGGVLRIVYVDARQGELLVTIGLSFENGSQLSTWWTP